MSPSIVYTDLARHMTRDDFSAGGTLANLEVTDVAHGAATTVWAATSPDLDGLGGRYLEQSARLGEWSQRQAELTLGG